MGATYKSVKSDMLARITDREWAPGDLIPNEEDLARNYGCSRATVNRALRELAEAGLVEGVGAEPGVGAPGSRAPRPRPSALRELLIARDSFCERRRGG